jgi:hypothetical protein
MQAGEIYLARFPFGDVPGMKLRPVLLLSGAVGPMPEVLVAYISSVLPARPLPSDLLLDPGGTSVRSDSPEGPFSAAAPQARDNSRLESGSSSRRPGRFSTRHRRDEAQDIPRSLMRATSFGRYRA